MHNIDDEDDEDITQVIKDIPSVVSKLRSYGHFEIWKKFNNMISNNEFPMDNIAYLLFLDIVKWYGSQNAVTMRYDETVTKFWRVGYKLFHGKFLRFMGGPKNKSHILLGDTMRGVYSPQAARVNFVIPNRKMAESSASALPAKDIVPGMLTYLLQKFAEQTKETETYKICLDGKKINSSVTGTLGDVDLFGYEAKPALEERKKRLENELKTVDICDIAVRGNFGIYFQAHFYCKHHSFYVFFLKSI
jgi:hypothetical protein